MAAAAIFDFLKVKFAGKTVSWVRVLVSVSNFVPIYAIATELWQLNQIYNGGRPPSLIYFRS